jgi:hypothetical protein
MVTASVELTVLTEPPVIDAVIPACPICSTTLVDDEKEPILTVTCTVYEEPASRV